MGESGGNETDKLFGALINPCANKADLFLGQRGDLAFAFRRRHEIVAVVTNVGDGIDQLAFAALAGDMTLPSLLPFNAPSRVARLSLLLGLSARDT